MSKRYKDHSILNILMVTVLLIVLAPVIPISIIFIMAIYLTNIKEKYIIFSSAAILILMFLLYQDIAAMFIAEFSNVFNQSVNNVMQGNLLSNLTVYKIYSLSSWLVIVLISLIVSGYFIGRINKQKRLSNAGINTLNDNISVMEEKTLSIESKPQKTDKKLSTLIGYNKTKKPVYCEDNAKHIFVCGTTGSGKTVLLSNYIKSAIEKNYGLLIIDGKGDMGNDSMLEITKKFAQENGRRLYIVNMNDPSHSSRYNPFAGASETVCKDMLINMTDWSEEHYKANAERYIQRLIKLLNLQGGMLSFERILQYMPTSKFEELSAFLTKTGQQTKIQHLENLELVKASGKIAENAGARFATIAESEIGTIFDETGIDIFTALNSGAIILFVLNPLIYPETSQVMGRLVLIDAKKAISKMFGNMNKRSFFIFDEINVYASTVLIDLINKSRSAGVTCIPATQSLADLEAIAGDAFKQQIIENCNNYIVLRQNSFSSAEEWAKTLGTKETMKMTYQVSQNQSTGMGTAKRVREFMIHPDEIKAQKTGTGIFLSRDDGKCERIKIIKPF